MKFKATAIHRTGKGTWLVRYYDQPITDLSAPAGVSRHRFQWAARLHAWAYMRSAS